MAMSTLIPTNAKLDYFFIHELKNQLSRYAGAAMGQALKKMGISYSAVALYTSNIYEKLQDPNVVSAVATAMRKGLI
jgi:hypothetical protein